jgi:hypothetical protein
LDEKAIEAAAQKDSKPVRVAAASHVKFRVP